MNGVHRYGSCSTCCARTSVSCARRNRRQYMDKRRGDIEMCADIAAIRTSVAAAGRARTSGPAMPVRHSNCAPFRNRARSVYLSMSRPELLPDSLAGPW